MPVTFKGGITVPPPFWYDSDTPVAFDTNHLIALTGWKIGVVLRAPKTGQIHGFEFPASTFWSPGYTIRASFMDVDPATGLPTGGNDQYGDFTGISSNTWVTAVEDLTDQGSGLLAHIAGGEFREVNAGDLIACVIEAVNGFATWRTILGQDSIQAFPYCVEYSGSWTKVASTHYPMVTLKYVTDVSVGIGVDIETEHVKPLGCLAHETERTFSDSTRLVAAPGAKSATFSLPWDFDCSGIHVFLNSTISGTAATYTVALKEGATTLATSGTLSGSYNEDANRGFAFAGWETVSLEANTEYTVTLTVLTGTVAVYESLYESTGHRSVGPGGPDFGDYDGSDLSQLRFHLIALPQAAAAPEVASRPVICGRAFTPNGCETDVPDDPAITLDSSPDVTILGFSPVIVLGIGLDHEAVAMTRPSVCTPFVPAYCDAPTS